MRKLTDMTCLLSIITRNLRGFLAALLIGASILNPIAAAEESISPGRAPASVKPGTPPMNQEAWDALNHAYLLRLVRYTNDLADQVKTRNDYARVYLSGLRAKDRSYLDPGTKNEVSPIRVKLDGNTLIFRDAANGYETLRVQWPKITENHLVVNGVDWNFNPRQAMQPQLDRLVRKLEYAQGRRSTSAFRLLFLNNAEAVNPLPFISAGKTVVMPVVNGVRNLGAWLKVAVSSGVTAVIVAGPLDVSCYLGYNVIKTFSAVCADWKDKVDKSLKKELETKSATVDTLERAKPKDSDTDAQTKWIPSKEQSCPSAADTKRNVFSADMLQLQVVAGGAQGSRVIPKNDWFALRIDFTGDKKPKSGFLAPQGTDTSASDAVLKATDVLSFDERGFLKDIKYKNPEPNTMKDPTYQDMLTIDMNSDDTKLSTKEVAKRQTIRSLVGSLNEWITFCNTKELIYQYVEQKKSGDSPQTNDVEAVNGRPVAPPTEPVAAPAKVVQ